MIPMIPILSAVALGNILILLLIIAAIGVFAWAVTTYLPMPQPIKGIIMLVAILLVLFVVLNFFGVFDGGGGLDSRGHRAL